MTIEKRWRKSRRWNRPGLNDRAFDAWEPLLAIAERVDGDWPKLATEAAIALSGGESATEERGVELLADIRAEFDRSRRDAITTKTLVKVLCADEERPWATYAGGKAITDRQLAKLLAPFDVTSDTVHPNETGEAKAKGYRRARFEDAFSRYLTLPNDASRQIGGEQACERASNDGTGITRDFCERAETNPHVQEKCEKPANDGGLHACTDKNSPTGHTHGSDQRDSGNGTSKVRSDAEDAYDDLTIPTFLDRRAPVCAHCGKPGGKQWDYDGAAVRLHDHCEQPWIANYKASRGRPTTTTAGSSR